MPELTTRRSPVRTLRRPGSAPLSGSESAGPLERPQQLQRRARNHAVAQLLKPAAAQIVQRAPSLENPPVSTLNPTGTMNDRQWTAAYRAAVAEPSVAGFEVLFRDSAVTAGMDQIPGFNQASIPTTDGKTAQPGLNFTLKSGETGHTAWIDQAGTFGVKLSPTKKQAPDVAIAIILGPVALSADKGLSLRTIRHEMVHARHKLKVLEAVRLWQAASGRAGLDDWLKQQVAKKKMSDLDLALISKGAVDAAANTEVLGYVEGFTNDYHRRAATWPRRACGSSSCSVSSPPRRSSRGRERTRPSGRRLWPKDYRASLDHDHQRLWKEWLDRESGKAVRDQPGRTEFLNALSAFVV